MRINKDSHLALTMDAVSACRRPSGAVALRQCLLISLVRPHLG
jgi:hypothetical protein